MKKCGWMALLALLGSLLLTSAMAWTEADYRTVTVEGQDYVLGESTLADFVEAGWTHYTEESDGMIACWTRRTRAMFMCSWRRTAEA